jgi:hypothetical protein
LGAVWAKHKAANISKKPGTANLVRDFTVMGISFMEIGSLG